MGGLAAEFNTEGTESTEPATEKAEEIRHRCTPMKRVRIKLFAWLESYLCESVCICG
jgi:hypothetical protein